ncbi:MAG: hypothetical protein OEZ39_05540 [Gammaproteobacteria bacterium]|nr:hypothetical protein [Gammaproteobacteria bacterium]MDH5651318.1 hypothetical protein [Gammaproteobacteria bacterium]
MGNKITLDFTKCYIIEFSDGKKRKMKVVPPSTRDDQIHWLEVDTGEQFYQLPPYLSIEEVDC